MYGMCNPGAMRNVGQGLLPGRLAVFSNFYEAFLIMCICVMIGKIFALLCEKMIAFEEI